MTDEYIKRVDALNKLLQYAGQVDYTNTLGAMIGVILRDIPAADVRTVVHAGWIVTARFDDCYYANCPVCNTTQVFYGNKELTKFCPNCGAVMDKEVDDG